MASKIVVTGGLAVLGVSGVYAGSEPNPQSKYFGEQICLSQPEKFDCVRVKSGQNWKKLFPNKKIREKVMRLNRRNLPIYAGMWIAVPKDLDKDYMDFAPCAFEIPATGKKLVRIFPKALAFCAYGTKGKLVHWGPISSGKYWCKDIGRDCSTPEGAFTVFNKKGKDCESKTFPVERAGGAKMPYCMFFYRGFAMHASTLPGYNDSHGCVRMFYKDAIWLNRGFSLVGSTSVEVVKDYD